MPEPAGMKYVAIRDIYYEDVPAYRTGQLVHESAVEGEGSWLVLGEDVEAREGAALEQPAGNASHAAWVAFAVSRGADRAEAEAMSRADLREKFAEPVG